MSKLILHLFQAEPQFHTTLEVSLVFERQGEQGFLSAKLQLSLYFIYSKIIFISFKNLEENPKCILRTC